MKSEKINARNTVVSTIRQAALELSNLATELEEIGQLDTLEKKLIKYPKILNIIRKGTWELQNARLDKAFSLIIEANEEIAADKLVDADVA